MRNNKLLKYTAGTRFSTGIILLLTTVWFTSCGGVNEKKAAYEKNQEARIEGEVKAVLTDAPEVPAALNRTTATKVIVDLEVIEQNMRLADSVDYTFWTFGGKVPGKFIRIREGDLVEFHLHNHPDNKVPHNIDLHAVTGPGGGAEASLTAPGHSTQFSFRALNPGLYVYHCATAPVGLHIANGMYGLILVEPKEGLPKVDREIYVMQGEFYTKGRFGEAGLQPFDMNKAVDEKPEYVVFNGAVGANAGDNAIKAKTGETIRIYIGNGGPNLVSSFHVIGEIFDKVYVEGGNLINHNVQTTLIPAGGAAMVEFKCEVPGTLNIVDHSIFRTFNKGALAQIKVEGDEAPGIYSHQQRDQPYLPAVAETAPAAIQTAAPVKELSKEEMITKGKAIYQQTCMACHQDKGQGLANAFPPVAASDFLQARKDKGIGILLHGLQGEITVNGNKYNSAMPAQNLSAEEIASVLTFIHQQLNNKPVIVSTKEVQALKDK